MDWFGLGAGENADRDDDFDCSEVTSYCPAACKITKRDFESLEGSTLCRSHFSGKSWARTPERVGYCAEIELDEAVHKLVPSLSRRAVYC